MGEVETPAVRNRKLRGLLQRLIDLDRHSARFDHLFELLQDEAAYTLHTISRRPGHHFTPGQKLAALETRRENMAAFRILMFPLIEEQRAAGKSWTGVAAHFNARGLHTLRGDAWTGHNVRKMHKRTLHPKGAIA